MFFLKNHIVKLFGTFEHLNFEFVSDFGFRISDFPRPKVEGIMQNEPNLKNDEISTKPFNTSTYVNLWLYSHRKNEPNVNIGKIDTNLIYKKELRENPENRAQKHTVSEFILSISKESNLRGKENVS